MIKQLSIPCINYNIKADWHDGTSRAKIILVLVGFGSSKKSNASFVERIVSDTGHCALVVDLSGHGESPFSVDDTCPAQHVLESVAAYDWIKDQYPDSIIEVMGTSYGGYIATYLTRHRSVSRLILRTPAIYEPNVFYTKHISIDKIRVREYRRNEALIKKHPLFMQPSLEPLSTLLIVHSKDLSVPTQTTNLYQSLLGAEQYVADGFVHAFRDPSNPTDQIEKYYSAISGYLSR